MSRFDRWWWRVWYVFVAAVLVWLGVCGWLMRPAPGWTNGWHSWWSADRHDPGEVRMIKPAIAAGTDVFEFNGDAAYRFNNAGGVLLGHWPKKSAPWTWSGWIHCSTTNGVWPESAVLLWSAITPGHGFSLDLHRGVPVVNVAGRFAGNSTNRVKVTLRGNRPLPLGRWAHVAFVTDGILLRLLVDGEVSTEQIATFEHYSALQLAPLWLKGNCQTVPAVLTDTGGLRVMQDDIILHDRAVPSPELQQAVAAGRGSFVREISRGQLAQRVWRFGWPAATALLVVLVGLRLAGGLRQRIASVWSQLREPGARPVRWTLAGGGVISVLLTGTLYWRAQVSDYERFVELLTRLKGETDLYWERMAGFANQARDWIAAHPGATQAQWEHWLSQNHYPHDMPGMIGIGYAVQVQPDGLNAHEAEWRARLGHDYKVHPPADASRQEMTELEGNPYLPVVLFAPRELERLHWQTNHTILGRDLLHLSLDDPRRWAGARHLENGIAENYVTTSSLETIAPEAWYGTAIRGVQIYSPLTTGTKVGDATFIKSNHWRGAVFANIDISKPLRERYGNGAPMIGCRVSIGGMGGEIFDTIADTGDLVPETAEQPDAWLRYRIKIPFYTHRMFIEAWTTKAFENQSLTRWAWVTGLACGGLTLLSATLLLVQIGARKSQAQVLDALEVANNKLLLAYHERERISRDLHDGSIQNLYALGLHLQRVQALFGAQSNRAQAGLKESLSMLDHSIAELRQFILATEPREATVSAPGDALAALVEQQRRTTDAEIVLRLPDDARRLGTRAGAHVLHMAREGISNALRHGKARRIEVQLDRQATGPDQRSRWVFELKDDGCGFDPAQISGEGRGLRNLRSRAADLGGECLIESVPNHGTTVRVTFVGDAPPLHDGSPSQPEGES